MEDQFDCALERYLEIQDAEKKLAQEKQELRDIIEKYLESVDRTQIIVNREDLNIHILKKEKISVKYNEAILQERLQEDYNNILSLDLKKVKKHKEKLEHLLGENVTIFGSPDRLKIKAAIENKAIDPQKFDHAFEKETKNIIYVRRKETKSNISDVPF